MDRYRSPNKSNAWSSPRGSTETKKIFELNEQRPLLSITNQMPDILRSVNAVFCLEGSLPFPAFSNIAAEALYCGSAVISDNPYLRDRLQSIGIEASSIPGIIIKVTIDEPLAGCQQIKANLESLPKSFSHKLPDKEAFENYVTKNEKLLLSVLSS